MRHPRRQRVHDRFDVTDVDASGLQRAHEALRKADRMVRTLLDGRSRAYRRGYGDACSEYNFPKDEP